MAELALLHVFVYGSLKKGESNHECFCRGALEIEEATVLGRLYDLPFGFPGLVVPKEDVRTAGTADYLADAHATRRLREARPLEARQNWDVIHGELLTFDDPEERLPAIDELEGFRPGGRDLYERVLLPVALSGSAVLAWAYAVRSASGVYLPGGRWPAG